MTRPVLGAIPAALGGHGGLTTRRSGAVPVEPRSLQQGCRGSRAPSETTKEAEAHTAIARLTKAVPARYKDPARLETTIDLDASRDWGDFKRPIAESKKDVGSEKPLENMTLAGKKSQS